MAQIVRVERAQAELKILGPRGKAGGGSTPPEEVPKLSLLLCYPKAKKIEQAIRQATELGVSEIHPILSDFAVPDLDAKTWAKKRERFEAIIMEAVQQCGASHIPLLGDPGSLDQKLGELVDGKVVTSNVVTSSAVTRSTETIRTGASHALSSSAPMTAGAGGDAHEGGPNTVISSTSLDDESQGSTGSNEDGAGTQAAVLGIYFHQEPLAQSGLHEYLQAIPRKVLVVVGPEGGLSERELGLLDGAGFHPAYMGATVLRVETAVVAALSAVKMICLEAKTWQFRGKSQEIPSL